MPDEGLHQTFAPDGAGPSGPVGAGLRPAYGHLSGSWTTRPAPGAASLVATGVGRGDRVPVVLRPGIELVTALLAVLRAGAAYAVLDPEWPAERLRDIIVDLDAGARGGASGPGTADRVVATAGARPRPADRSPYAVAIRVVCSSAPGPPAARRRC